MLAPLVALLGLLTGAQCNRPTDSRPPAVDPPRADASSPIFRDVTGDAGLDFFHDPGSPGDFFFPEIMAGGAALLDFDNDGDLDIYLVNGSRDRPGRGPSSTNEPPAVNRLYRQEQDGRFAEVTKGSGLDDPGYGMGVAVGDINNDGLPDVYVSNYGPDRLFLNRGGGRFEDITESSGIDNPNWGTSASFVDFDRDGRLDLFVANYVDYDPSRPCRNRRGVRDFCHPSIFASTADRLFHNQSDLPDAESAGKSAAGIVGQDGANLSPSTKIHFRDVSLAAGIARYQGAGLGVACLDVNQDSWPDIYVANDGQANRLWVNQRNGTFRDEAILRGAAYDLFGAGQASMGVAMGDLNGDGRFDLLLTHFGGENNALYLSDGPGQFRESSDAWGIAAPSFPFTGFGTVLADFDRDGALDLAVVNGRVVLPDGQQQPPGGAATFYEAYAEPNQLFRNDSQCLRPLNFPAEAFGGPVEVSRALAMGDIDNDGDVDLLVSNIGGPARLLQNVADSDSNWLGIRAVEPRYGNRDAYGALVTVRSGDQRWVRLVQPGSSYLTSHDPRIHFGLGETRRVDSLEVIWPDGSRETFPGGEVNRYLVLAHGQGGQGVDEAGP